jgi:hypothetical protein
MWLKRGSDYIGGDYKGGWLYSVIITVRKVYESLRSKYSVIITDRKVYEGLRSK